VNEQAQRFRFMEVVIRREATDDTLHVYLALCYSALRPNNSVNKREQVSTSIILEIISMQYDINPINGEKTSATPPIHRHNS